MTADPSLRGVVLDIGGLEVREAGEYVAEVEGSVDAPAATTAQDRVEDGVALAETLYATFERRAVHLPQSVPLGLSDEFAQDKVKQIQWRAFWKKAVRREPVPDLPQIVTAVSRFLLPAVVRAKRQEAFAEKWPAGGPWSSV